MSRSYRHTPIGGICNFRSSEKFGKRWSSHKHRNMLNSNMSNENWEWSKYNIIVSNWSWQFKHDGKSWFGKPFLYDDIGIETPRTSLCYLKISDPRKPKWYVKNMRK